MTRCWKGFQAARDIDAGRLPKRKDAVEYIAYLRDTVQGLASIIADQAKELEALRGPMKWEPSRPDTVWVSVHTPGMETSNQTCRLADDVFKRKVK